MVCTLLQYAVLALCLQVTHLQTEGVLLTTMGRRRCRAVGASMQGAVSAACMVATAAVQAAEHPLPQTLLVQCPADIRQQVTSPALKTRPSALTQGALHVTCSVCRLICLGTLTW